MSDWRYNYRPGDDSKADYRKLGQWRHEGSHLLAQDRPGGRWAVLVAILALVSALLFAMRCL